MHSLAYSMSEQDKIIEIIDRIIKEYDPERIILFGSYAFGTENSDSDVDLFVVKESEMPRPLRTIALRKLLTGAGIPLDLIVYTPHEVEESKGNVYSFVHEVLKTGKIVYEREKA